MDESIGKDCSINNRDAKKPGSMSLYIILAGICLLIVGVSYLVKCGLFDRDANNIYADLKDYQTCKVVSGYMKNEQTINALVCELAPSQQKNPETVKLAQNKVIEINEEIKRYNSETIKQLNALLDDDFVRKNPERAIDHIIAELKIFDLCLVVSSENTMAVDCSLKEKDSSYFRYGVSEVEKVNEYHQKQAKINHQLSLIDKKYFNYFQDERNKESNEEKILLQAQLNRILMTHYGLDWNKKKLEELKKD